MTPALATRIADLIILHLARLALWAAVLAFVVIGAGIVMHALIAPPRRPRVKARLRLSRPSGLPSPISSPDPSPHQSPDP